MLLFEMALRQNAESLGWQPSWVFSFFFFLLAWIWSVRCRRLPHGAGRRLADQFFFFFFGFDLYAVGGSHTESDADSQTSSSFLDFLFGFLDFWILFFGFFGFLDLFFGFFGFYFDFDHGTIIAVALGTRDPIVVTRLLTGEAVGER